MIVKLKHIGLAIFLSASIILANDINGRFVVTNTDSSKLAVLLQVNTMTGTDAIGGATIVLGFDSTAINLTNDPVENLDYIFHNFSGSYYSIATITRPMNGRIWVNIDLPYNNSSNGTVVSDTSGWTDVVTIYFDITDANGVASLNWLSTSPFWGIYEDDNITLLEPNLFQNLIYNYDIASPQLVSASLLDSVNLEIEFSESLDSTSALNISNYSIDNSINILGITKSSNQNKLIINTTTHNFGQQYLITVNNVYDLSGNLISANHNSAEYPLHPSNVEEDMIPTEFLLSQNYPNPFNPTTTIKFSLPDDSNIKLIVYNLLGEEVRILADGFYNSGIYEFKFDAAGLASGVYIYRLEGNDFVENKKMVYLR